MSHSTPLSATTEAARAFVTSLSRPAGMTRATYAGVHAVLEAIVSFYPKAWPSVLKISARTGIPERTVQRHIATAIKQGWLVVLPDGGTSRTRRGRTNRYFVPDMTPTWRDVHDAKLSPEEIKTTYGGLSEEPSALRTTSSDPQSVGTSGADVVHLPSGAVRKGEEQSRQVTTASPPLPTKKASPPAKPSASAIVSAVDTGTRAERTSPRPSYRRGDRLARYFEKCWAQVQESRPDLRSTRPLESVGHVRTYDQRNWAELGELEVRALMDLFVTQVSAYDVKVKPGQSGWMALVGSWGRNRGGGEAELEAYYRRSREARAVEGRN